MMSDDQILALFKQRQKELKRNLVYPVLVAVFVVLIGSIWTYFGKIQSNRDRILLLEQAKVDQKNFNEFLKAQNEINILQEERQRILREDVDSGEKETEEILKRIQELEKQIEIIQIKNQKRLGEYGMRTRDGGEVILGLEWFVKDTTPET